MGKKKINTRPWRGNLKERNQPEDMRVGGRILSKWILNKENDMA
jgi:hypothetical protein